MYDMMGNDYDGYNGYNGYDGYDGMAGNGYDEYNGYNGYNGMEDNCGVPKYVENPQYDMNPQLLAQLGFTVDEIQFIDQAVNQFGRVSSKILNFCGIVDGIAVQRLNYAYKICTGDVQIDTEDPIAISKHFKKLLKMSGRYTDFSCAYIPHTNAGTIPRTAVVAGIPDGSFSLLNTDKDDFIQGVYKVQKIAKEWVWIYCTKSMTLMKTDRLTESYENKRWGIPEILEVIEIGNRQENKPWVLKIHKKHCRLCNRFMVMASTTRPTNLENNLFGVQLVLQNGAIVWVYAFMTPYDKYGNPSERIPAATNNKVVCSYGYYANEIQPLVMKTVNDIQNMCPIVYSKSIDQGMKYEPVSRYCGYELIGQSEVGEDTLDYEDYDGYESDESDADLDDGLDNI